MTLSDLSGSGTAAKTMLLFSNALPTSAGKESIMVMPGLSFGRYMCVVVVTATLLPAAASSRAHAKMSEVFPPAPVTLMTACSGKLSCSASVILFCSPLKLHSFIRIFYYLWQLSVNASIIVSSRDM